MRSSERVGTEGDHLLHAELDCERRHHVGEPAPLRIGLRAAEGEHVVDPLVAADAHLDVGPHEANVDTVAQLHRRPPCPVVDEGVAVESGQWSYR